MNKKASVLDIIIWIIAGFIILLFLAVYMYGHNQLTEKLLELNIDIGDTNIATIADNTFGQVNSGLNSLRWLSFTIIFALAISILISNFLVKAHPVFFIVYFFIVVLAIVFSVFVSNSYEGLMTNQLIGDTLQSYVGSSFIMLNLPLWVTIIGVFGAIVLFIGIIRDRRIDGGVF